MKRTIELDHESEARLYEWAKALGTGSEEEALQAIAKAMLDTNALNAFMHGQTGRSKSALADFLRQRLEREAATTNLEAIKSTPNVMGGDACIRNTRIPVWLLVSYKSQGMSDSQLLANYPGLNAADLIIAWDYYASHAEEVRAERKRHDDAA